MMTGIMINTILDESIFTCYESCKNAQILVFPHQVLLRNTPFFVVFTKVIRNLKSNSSQLGVFSFPYLPLWIFHVYIHPQAVLGPRLTHSEAAETFSDLLTQLPPGRLRCSALLNRAPLGKNSWEFRWWRKFLGTSRRDMYLLYIVLVEYGLKFWITLSTGECIFDNMHITGV